MGVVFALIWSSAFSSARIIVADAPPLGALALRYLISGTIGVGLARLMGQNWWLTPAQWRATILFGIAQNTLYLGLNFVAMQSIEASLAAIIASTMPLLVALAGVLLLRERLSAAAWGGLLAGLAGVAIIMGARIEAGVDLRGVLLAGGGALALTAATLAVRTATGGGNLLMIVGLQMLVGAMVLSVASAFLEKHEVVPSRRLMMAFAYTTLVPGLAATWIWFALVRRIGAVKAATFHFLNPFFGVAIAALTLGETVRGQDIFGALIIGAGILMVQLSRSSAETAGPDRSVRRRRRPPGHGAAGSDPE